MYSAFRLRWWRSSHWHRGRCQRKQKKSIDQRAPQIGYEGIKRLRSLAMKNYLVTGGLLSLVESYNYPYESFWLPPNYYPNQFFEEPQNIFSQPKSQTPNYRASPPEFQMFH